MDPMPSSPTYPMLQFLVRRGRLVAMVLGAAPALAALAAVLLGHSPLYLLAGVAAGAVTYLLMRSYVELVQVMVEMLLPR